MGWEPWVIVIGGFVAIGAALRGWSWWLRERVVRALSDRPLVRSARGVSLRVMVRGQGVLPGMTSNRTHRTRGDLILLEDRFVIPSSRGKLIDMGEGHGLRFSSVRCPGPQKLVLEGSVPQAGSAPGRFRIEALLPDAQAWVEALQPFVDPEGGAPFGTRIPSASP